MEFMLGSIECCNSEPIRTVLQDLGIWEEGCFFPDPDEDLVNEVEYLITKKGRTTMIRVTKPIARRLFRQGKVIHLVPCKCRPEDWKPVCINQESDEMFDRLVADFIYQNCNDKEGYYPHYYIEEGE